MQNRVLSDLQFDMVSVLHSKGKALEAYDKYLRDAQEADSEPCVQLLQKLKRQDEIAIEEIKQHVVQLLQHGRMQSGMGKSSSQSASGRGAEIL